jgi:Flp pilus assembly protein TadD
MEQHHSRKTMDSSILRASLLAGAGMALAACSLDSETTRGDLAASPAAQRGDSAAVMLARAEELRAGGKPVQALSWLAEAHRRFPNDGAVASAYGRTALLLGHDAVAAPLLAQAIAANPRDWRAFSAQGVLDSRRGRLPDGRRALVKANMISASEAVILNNLAVSHLLEGKAEAAASLLRQGLASPELRPDYERRLKRNLAVALAVEGQFQEADRLAGERLPRDLAGADPARLAALMGVNEARLAAETGWKSQLAAREREAPALQ